MDDRDEWRERVREIRTSSTVDDVWTNGVQVLQHRQMKYVNLKENYVEKYTSFGYILWENLGQLTDFSAELCKYKSFNSYRNFRSIS